MEAKIEERISELIQNLEHSDKEVQDKSENALIEIGDPAVELLIESLPFTKEVNPLSLRVANILSKIGSKKVVDILLEKMLDYDWNVRAPARIAIEKIGDSRVIDPLLRILFTNIKRDHREYAERVLENIGEPVVEQLIRALTDKEPDIRVRAARLLGKIKDIRAIHPLTEVISKDENYDVRMVAKRALEGIRVKTG